MLSGGMAALAGAVLALRAGTGGVSAIDFPAEVSLLLVAMVIIGGLGSLLGAGLGAFLVFGLRPLLASALGSPSWVPYVVTFGSGFALILVLTRARGGLAGLFFLPRDPVVQGLVWQDQESRGTDGSRETADALEETREMATTAPRPRSGARSSRR